MNKYRLEKEDPLHILDVDNQMVRKQQIEQLQHIKATRDNNKVKACLAKLTDAAKSSTEHTTDSDSHQNENLLSLAVEAARNRATLGEISDALEAVFGSLE